MSKTTTKTADTAESKILVLYGVDEHGKPRAARFTDANSDLVAKAGKTMALQTATITTEDQSGIAMKLPVGRLYANGKSFVPHIRRDLFAKLNAALSGEPNGSPGLPRSWDEIAAGHMVIAQETLEDGWWEAIVLDRTGDMVTLKWRDYPRVQKFKRNVAAVALIRPLVT